MHLALAFQVPVPVLTTNKALDLQVSGLVRSSQLPSTLLPVLDNGVVVVPVLALALALVLFLDLLASTESLILPTLTGFHRVKASLLVRRVRGIALAIHPLDLMDLPVCLFKV